MTERDRQLLEMINRENKSKFDLRYELILGALIIAGLVKLATKIF